MQIRAYRPEDRAALWGILQPVVREGETYALPQDMTEDEAIAYWTGPDRETFVAEENGEVFGTYFIKQNQLGGGAHVANCGYVTGQNATGRGIARAMCAHSLEYARAQGYKAMQFNFVVSTNVRAVRLWESCGFEIVGTLPRTFNSPQFGYVDVYVMYREL